MFNSHLDAMRVEVTVPTGETITLEGGDFGGKLVEYMERDQMTWDYPVTVTLGGVVIPWADNLAEAMCFEGAVRHSETRATVEEMAEHFQASQRPMIEGLNC